MARRQKLDDTKNILRGFLKGLKPIARLTVSEWAELFRFLSSKSSAEPGRWKNSRTPYLVEIMDRFSPYDQCEEIIFMKGSQIGATEAFFNAIGFYIGTDPCPMIYVMPTEQVVMRNSKIRFDPMIEATPQLSEKIGSHRSRDKENSVLQKSFPGGVMMFCGANSPAPLRSVPVRVVILDEVDAMPSDIGGEGSPIDLAKARTRTFYNRKIALISTPTIEGASQIEAEFLTTSQRKYFVPCPECGLMQSLEFERLQCDPVNLEKVSYICSGCDHPIPERDKTWMLANGQWTDTVPENANPKRIGYHLSALYSPLGMYSWGDLMKDYRAAVGKETKMVAFTNTVLGETYKQAGEAPEWEQLFARRENYPVYAPPKDVVLLTAGVDVQADRLEVEIVGWCEGRRSYSIDYRVLIGDTSSLGPVWSQLQAIVSERWKREDGAELHIEKMCIDSGYNTTIVYDFCRQFHPSQVVPVKGQEKQAVILTPPRAIDRAGTKGAVAGTTGLWHIGVSILKSEVYASLKLKVNEDGSYPDGYCHFPTAYDVHYFKMLAAESLTKRIVRGYPVFQWEKNNYARNEALDCRVYARAAAAMVGVDRWTAEDWKAYDSARYGRSEPQGRQERGKRRSSFWEK